MLQRRTMAPCGGLAHPAAEPMPGGRVRDVARAHGGNIRRRRPTRRAFRGNCGVELRRGRRRLWLDTEVGHPVVASPAPLRRRHAGSEANPGIRRHAHWQTITAPRRNDPLTFCEELLLVLLTHDGGAFASIPCTLIDHPLAGTVPMGRAYADRIDTDLTSWSSSTAHLQAIPSWTPYSRRSRPGRRQAIRSPG